MLTTEVIWKPSNFFTSVTDKLQESRFFHRFANSPFANQEVKGEHSCSQSNEKPLEKSPCLFFLWRTTLLLLFCLWGKTSFSHCASFNRGRHVVFCWCRLMSGFSGGTDARVPEPGNRSGWGWAAPEALPEEMVQQNEGSKGATL